MLPDSPYDEEVAFDLEEEEEADTAEYGHRKYRPRANKVANPKAILQFAKQRQANDKKNLKRRPGAIAFDLDDIGDIDENTDEGRSKMEDIVAIRLSEPESKLTLLPESGFTYAVQQFVNKNETKQNFLGSG